MRRNEYVSCINPNNASMQTSIGSTSPIPKLETYAMLLAGLGLLGFVARRRKGTAVAV